MTRPVQTMADLWLLLHGNWVNMSLSWFHELATLLYMSVVISLMTVAMVSNASSSVLSREGLHRGRTQYWINVLWVLFVIASSCWLMFGNLLYWIMWVTAVFKCLSHTPYFFLTYSQNLNRMWFESDYKIIQYYYPKLSNFLMGHTIWLNLCQILSWKWMLFLMVAKLGSWHGLTILYLLNALQLAILSN